MAKYRTAMGKMVDMTALSSRHEKTRAVGNMNVNARGDTIDSQGRVIVPVTKKANKNYQNTVANRGANVVRKKTEPAEVAVPELTAEETELKNSYEDDAAVEQLKAQEFKVKPASEAPDFFKPD